MTIGDILLQNNKATLDDMLPLSKVQTADDIKRYLAMGYCVGMTADEFSKKYPVLPIENIYASCNMLDPLYYCDFVDTPTAKAVEFLHHPSQRCNRSHSDLHDVRQA